MVCNESMVRTWLPNASFILNGSACEWTVTELLLLMTTLLNFFLYSNLVILIGLLFCIADFNGVFLFGEKQIVLTNALSDVCNWHVVYLTFPEL